MSDDENEVVAVVTGPSDEDVMSTLKEKETEVNRLVGGGSGKQALQLALKEPPFKNGAECKELNYKLVMKAIGAVKESDFKDIVSEMDSDQKDVLMKYVYRGMEHAENCAALLKLHAILSEDGVGVIVRALVERQTV
eukprot:Rmarinus@m.1924